MQLIELDGELAHRVDDDGQGQRGDVGVEEPVEATADTIVVERRQLGRTQAEEAGDVPRRPFADAVERLAGHEEVLEQEQEPGGRADARSPVFGGRWSLRNWVSRSRRKSRSRMGRTPMWQELRVRPAARAVVPGRCGEAAGSRGRRASDP